MRDRQDIYQIIYEKDKMKEAQDEKGVDRSYDEVLNTIRDLISNLHGRELSKIIDEEGYEREIKSLISKYLRETKINVKEVGKLSSLVDRIYDDMAGFGFINRYLKREDIEEINGNAWNDIEIVTATGWEKISDRFLSPQQSIDIVRKMLQCGGVTVDESFPTGDSFIRRGIRVSAILPPVGDEDCGASFSIRKQRNSIFTKEQLVGRGTATDEMLDFIVFCASHGVSLGVAGATNSGKTALLNFILNNLPVHKRVFTIEDTRELNFRMKDGRGRVQNRVINTKTRKNEDDRMRNIDEKVLLKRALRFNPDVIVPAEMRGEEAGMAVEAGRTGHTIVTSFHASTAFSAYTRILTMWKMDKTDLSEELMMKAIIEAFPVMLFLSQLPDQSRKIMSIVEAEKFAEGVLKYRVIYEYIPERNECDEEGRVKKVHGVFVKTGPVSDKLANRLLLHGAEISRIRKFADVEWLPGRMEGDTCDL